MKQQAIVIPEREVAEFVRDLARQHHVHYRRTAADELADAITRLADDDVTLDEIECLMIALRRAGVLTADNFVPVQVKYLRERLGVPESLACGGVGRKAGAAAGVRVPYQRASSDPAHPEEADDALRVDYCNLHVRL